ncbi:MAG: FAD-dependent oxidoreductase [Planctomycetota bacterium]
MTRHGSVLVLGGGVAGIQAAIDLAGMGLKVHLVERSPSIGGRMAQLDKTFPTNDCAICILAPKMIECAGHRNVELLTYAEVVAVAGEEGDFTVTVRRHPRYVSLDRCTACGECVEKCPWKVPDEFDVGLARRRAIYLPFPQAVPRKMTIDPDRCVFLKDPAKNRCRLCETVCQAGAIDWDEKEETLELRVGAIVVATGFDPYDPSGLEEYAYGRVRNVITGLQYERLVSASGPTGGELQRPSDGAHPKKVAFIQCVGSRDINSNAFCSSVCCMFATKEAILAHEHDTEAESFIFYTDLRAGGKRFQEYVTRAQEEYRVTYVRGRPGVIGETPDTENPIVRYEDTTAREVKEMEVDLVVLCQALVPRRGQAELAKVLGIDLDEHGFVRVPQRLSGPVDTSRPGVFACGYCQGPADIPESVVQASGAAARVAEALA